LTNNSLSGLCRRILNNHGCLFWRGGHDRGILGGRGAGVTRRSLFKLAFTRLARAGFVVFAAVVVGRLARMKKTFFRAENAESAEKQQERRSPICFISASSALHTERFRFLGKILPRKNANVWRSRAGEMACLCHVLRRHGGTRK
jgi:hypothetical protein